MARKKKVEVAPVEEVVEVPVEEVSPRVPQQSNVTVHLDRDPNDERVVRVRKHENKLPSLDD